MSKTTQHERNHLNTLSALQGQDVVFQLRGSAQKLGGRLVGTRDGLVYFSGVADYPGCVPFDSDCIIAFRPGARTNPLRVPQSA